MKPKYKIGDHIIINDAFHGMIKDIEEGSDDSIWYIICWRNGTLTTHSIIIEEILKIDTRESRNDKLSKILDK